MRRSPDAPIQIGGCGCCTGRGLQRGVLDRVVSTLEREVVGGEQAAHDLHRFLERVDAVLQRRGTGCRADGAPRRTRPRRSVSSSRPPDAWSMVIASAANTAGWRYVMPVTSSPSRTRSVMPLSAASVVLPSKHSPGPVAVHGLEVVEAPDAVEAERRRRTGPGRPPPTRACVAGRCRVRSASGHRVPVHDPILHLLVLPAPGSQILSDHGHSAQRVGSDRRETESRATAGAAARLTPCSSSVSTTSRHLPSASRRS